MKSTSILILLATALALTLVKHIDKIEATLWYLKLLLHFQRRCPKKDEMKRTCVKDKTKDECVSWAGNLVRIPGRA